MTIRLIQGDALERLRELPAESVQCCVTSPPYYGLRDYQVAGQIGLEPTPDEFVARLVAVFAEVRRVLRPDGLLWLNIGDSFAGSWGNQSRKDGRGHQRPINGGMISRVNDGRYPSRKTNTGKVPDGAPYKPKDLIGIPWLLAFALRADGWYLRDAIVWAKPNPMTESVKDRCTKAYEHVFMLAKSQRYFFDAAAIAEPSAGAKGSTFDRGKTAGHQALKPLGKTVRIERETANARNVWTIASEPCAEAHFAVMPTELARRCILAGSRPGNTILDPFSGAGTTALVADRLQRDAIGIELNPAYIEITHRRIQSDAGLFAEVA